MGHVPRVRELRARGALSLLVVPQCAFGPGPHGKLFQKYTGLLLSRRAAARLADLRLLRCNHHRHDALACGDDAALAAAYPTALNDALVWALAGVRRTRPLFAPFASGSTLPGTFAEATCGNCQLLCPGKCALGQGAFGEAFRSSTPRRPSRHVRRARTPQPSAEARDARQDDARRDETSDVPRFAIADGPRLSTHVRAAVEQARGKRKRWASHRNLEPA